MNLININFNHKVRAIISAKKGRKKSPEAMPQDLQIIDFSSITE
jgi:hypothetical protein